VPLALTLGPWTKSLEPKLAVFSSVLDFVEIPKSLIPGWLASATIDLSFGFSFAKELEIPGVDSVASAAIDLSFGFSFAKELEIPGVDSVASAAIDLSFGFSFAKELEMSEVDSVPFRLSASVLTPAVRVPFLSALGDSKRLEALSPLPPPLVARLISPALSERSDSLWLNPIPLVAASLPPPLAMVTPLSSRLKAVNDGSVVSFQRLNRELSSDNPACK
jgi:hypothetical protein